MFQIDPLSMIPDSLKTAARDAAVDFVSDQAKKFLGDEVSAKIKKLRSDAAFNQKFEQGLKNAIKRFSDEYEKIDKELAVAIEQDVTIFKNEQVQKALLEMLKNPGRYLADEQEMLAERFATVLPKHESRNRVDQAIIFLLRCLAEELWNLPELQPIYTLQFQKMTAESMHQQVELQKAQLLEMTQINKGVRDALLNLTDAIGEQKILASSELSNSSASPKVLHNLPHPDYDDFVGREEELSKIKSLLSSSSRHFLITIDGVGGIGKSALALEAAYYYLNNYETLPPHERFDAIVWASAKLSILEAGGIKSRYHPSRTLNDIYTAISITLKREDITRASANEQAEIVRNALAKQRTLLVIDNFETIDDSVNMSFLQDLPMPTKAIVTTRYRLDVAYPIRLSGMSKEDASLLIKQECESKNVSLDKNDSTKLLARTGGVPLAIVWSIARMGLGHTMKTVLHGLSVPQNDIARFCFDEIINIIKTTQTDALKVLMALCLFAKDAERRAISEATKLPELELDEAITDLEICSLVNKISANKQNSQMRFSLLPLTKLYIADKIQEFPDIYPDLYNEYWSNLAAYYVRWSEEKDSLVAGRSVESFNDWRYERENFLSVIDQAYARKEYRLFLDLILTASYFQYTLGYWEERNHYAQMGILVAQNIGDMNSYARLVHDVAYMANSEGDLETAERLCNESQRVFRSLDDEWHLGSSLRLGGLIYAELGDFERAKKDLQEDVEIMTRLKSNTGLIIAYNALADIAITQKDFSVAHQLLDTSYDIAKKQQHFDGISHCLALFGKLSRAEGKLQEAEQYFRESLDYEERMERHPYQAMRLVKLAKVILEQGNKIEAEQLAIRAKEMAERVGMKKVIGQAESVLQKVRS